MSSRIFWVITLLFIRVLVYHCFAIRYLYQNLISPISDGESWSAAKERMARKQQKLSRSEERILQLKKAVVNFADQMTEFEKDLRCTTPVGADADKMKKSYVSYFL